MILKPSRPVGCLLAVLVFSLAGLSVLRTRAQAGDDKTDATNNTEPLYLHWIKPWYAGDKSPPEHILTLRVMPSKEFYVAFSDSKLKRRQTTIEGRIDRRNGRYHADFQVSRLSVERYRDELKLDEPSNGSMLAFSGAYFPTQVALSQNRSAKAILATAASAGQ